jgi:alkylhydroperoxidase family enzyme
MKPIEIRQDLVAAHERVWERLGRAGTWLDGATRIAVAEETRKAPSCSLCARRKAALSPYGNDGEHDSLALLPRVWVEAIHRIVSDPGRLVQSWYRSTISAGIEETQYVEMVSVIAHVVALDTFALALGVERRALSVPQPGAPSRYRPGKVRHTDAWVPTLGWGDADPEEADLVSGPVSNIRRALTLVPDEARSFFDLAAHQYLSGPQMFDFSREYRAITHVQIELLAARVSALNQCTY